jgi:hypothetical protein
MLGDKVFGTKAGQKGQQLYFLNTENCLIFASAEGEDSERMRGCGGRKTGDPTA